jgi:hypothetical protein
MWEGFGEMDTELAVLASSAATTIVTLMATDAWDQVKAKVGALWRRFRPAQADAIEAELTRGHLEIVSADETVALAAFEADAERLGVTASGGDLPVRAGRFRNAPVRVPARDVLQPELVLQFRAGFPGLEVVVPGAGLGAVLADQADRDMDVVVAVLGQAVMDGDPPARGLAVRAVKAQRPDQGVRGLGPLGVGERAFPGLEGERAVPHRTTRHVYLPA